MPAIKSLFAKITFCTLAAAFALTGHTHLNQASEKRGRLYKAITHTSKLKAPVSVKISALDDAEVIAGNTYDIEAVIQAPQDFENLTWEWLAPAEVELLDRNYGQALNVSAESEVKLRMRFRQGSDANHLIRLVLKDASTGAIMGRGRFNTTKQRAMASETAELMQRQEEYLEENPNVLDKSKKPKHTH